MVASIDNVFLNMCSVVVSTIFLYLLGSVYRESFQDVLQFPFSLILMLQQLLELLTFLIATFFLPQSEDICKNIYIH